MIPSADASFLGQMYLWGIEVIKVIQIAENPVLTAFLKIFTTLGTDSFYVPAILFIFWWVNEKQGLKFAILIMFSAWINSFIKDLWKQPRPYNLDPSLGLAYEPTYGAPSGHAQMSFTFWVPMAAWLSSEWKKKKPEQKCWLVWAGAVFIILLMGFSRLYLGVHFPTDLFAGWIIAAIILTVYFLAGPRIEKLLSSISMRYANISVALIVLIMNWAYPKDQSMPALLLGFCIGYTVMKKYFPFSARGEIKGKKPGISAMIFRCLIGFAGMAVIYIGLSFLFPGEKSLFSAIPVWGAKSPFYLLGRFIRYGLIGLWASAGAPRIFQQMGLAADPKAGK